MKLFAKCLAVIALVITTSMPATAQGLIRDAEIEASIKQLARPLLKAAGLPTGSVKFFIVNNAQPNAFVTNGRQVFIHEGLIRKLKTPEQLQAVIAHELGHITGGHIAKRYADFGRAKTNAMLGLLLGAIVAAAGEPGAATGVVAGVGSSSTRAFLGHTRDQEEASDRTGLRLMMAAGINPQANVEVLEYFEGQDLMTARKRDPFVQTHPLSAERLASVRAIANANQDRQYKTDPKALYYYQRMQAKFRGFVGNPSATIRKVGTKDQSETAIYARAIAYHKMPNRKKAAIEMDKLLKLRPDDPFYNELSGQFFLENGQTKAAIAAYSKAVSLAPKEPQILAGLGRAQLAGGQVNAALATLQKAYARDARNGRMLRDLAAAYAQAGQPGWANVVTAERYALVGNFGVASTHAKRAQGLLPRGSVGWNKAQDVLAAAERAGAKRL